MTIPIGGEFGTTAPADTYPLLDEGLMHGAMRTVANAAARLAIPSFRRKEGMMVRQLDTGQMWTLLGGIADVNWILDPLGIADALRVIFPNTGNVYFVDGVAGVDAAGRGTYANPCLTIDYTIENYVTDANGDVVICSSGVLDENAHNEGVRMNKNYVTLIARNRTNVTNTKVGRTAVITNTTVGNRILGFHIDAAAVIGINGTQDDIMIGNPDFPVDINGASVGIVVDSTTAKISNLNLISCIVGVQFNGSRNELWDFNFYGTNAGGSIGIDIAATMVGNVIHRGSITNFETGINAPALAVRNTAYDVAINCDTPSLSVVDANAAGLNNWNVHIANPSLQTGVDSALTVLNGINPITIGTAVSPIPIARFKNATIIINGAYVGGGNSSFKDHAAALSYLEAWIEIQTANDVNWRRITPSNDAYRLYQNDTQDCLVIDHINAAVAFRLRAALSVAPTDTIDLDWQILVDNVPG